MGACTRLAASSPPPALSPLIVVLAALPLAALPLNVGLAALPLIVVLAALPLNVGLAALSLIVALAALLLKVGLAALLLKEGLGALPRIGGLTTEPAHESEVAPGVTARDAHFGRGPAHREPALWLVVQRHHKLRAIVSLAV